MRGAQDLLRIGAPAVVLEAAREAIGVALRAPVSVLILPMPFLPWPSQWTLAVFSFIESSW